MYSKLCFNNVPLLSRTNKYLSKRLCCSNNVSTISPDESPLSGVRILDLTRIVAGPYCTMILGDLGAEVIKIERPEGGNEARKWGPPFVGSTNETCYFLCLNRNKKSVCVDLKSARGKEVIYDLARQCDVLVENYVPGKLDSLQLGFEQLRKVSPGLIYCSITGYGPVGPYTHRPGYDVIAASVGGLLNITGPRDGAPAKVGVAVTDIATGLYAHGAILAALIKRAKSGRGQKIDCNLLSTQVASLINIGANFLIGGRSASRWGTAHESIVPYEAFPTRDGYFTVGTGSDKQFKDLCQRIDLAYLSDTSKYLTNQDRVKNREELLGLLRNAFATKSNSEWAAVFEGALFPYGPVNDLQATFSDPHVQAIGLVHEVQHPTAGPIKMVGPAVQYGEGGNAVRLPPPLLGEHTADVLREVLGYDGAKISALQECKAIR